MSPWNEHRAHESRCGGVLARAPVSGTIIAFHRACIPQCPRGSYPPLPVPHPFSLRPHPLDPLFVSCTQPGTHANCYAVAFKLADAKHLPDLSLALLALKEECHINGRKYIRSAHGGKQSSTEGHEKGMQVVFLLEFEVSIIEGEARSAEPERSMVKLRRARREGQRRRESAGYGCATSWARSSTRRLPTPQEQLRRVEGVVLTAEPEGGGLLRQRGPRAQCLQGELIVSAKPALFLSLSFCSAILSSSSFPRRARDADGRPRSLPGESRTSPCSTSPRVRSRLLYLGVVRTRT